MKRLKSVTALMLAFMLGIGMTALPAAAAETETETEVIEETAAETEVMESEAENGTEAEAVPAAETEAAETEAAAAVPAESDVPVGEVYTFEPETELIDTSDTSIPSADDLFAGYVDKVFEIENEESILVEGRQAGGRLTGFNALVYEKLRKDIEAVAAGEQSSTVFEVTLADLGIEDRAWTADELGVDAIVSNGSITSEAMEALDAKTGLDQLDNSMVIKTLLHDLPYDFYWYDKTSGVKRTLLGCGAAYDGYEWQIYYSGSMKYRFSVAGSYSAGDYTVDTSTGQKVSTAKANADAVVTKYASKSDYEKLCAYKNEICSRTDYNRTAATDSSTPYGDPWQMIWVFDGDSSTNVVCEGYAKSFQYLCDQSSFNSKSVKCTAVSGTMAGGTGAGSHMWDIVSMNDGKNYLVDVTNCDEGSSGADDLLFLVGADSGSVSSGYSVSLDGDTIRYTYGSDMFALYDTPMLTLAGSDYDPSYVCRHTSTSVVDKKAATCEEKGYTGDTVCNNCGEIISRGQETAATGHSWGAWKVVKAATEEEEGQEERVCANDSSHKETRTIAKLNHTHTVQKIAAKAATCTTDGNIEYYECTKCHKLYTTSAGTKEITAADTVVKATGHSWDSGKVTKAATCVAKGVKTYTCTRDASHTKTEEIPVDPQNHTGGTEVRNARSATCTAAGYSGDTYCKGCNAKIASGSSIAATGHNWGAWKVVKAATEEEEGQEERVCANDSSHKETRAIAKLNHTHTVQKVAARAATCTTAGNIEYYECTKCHKLYTTSACTKEITAADTVVKATGHSWDSGKVTKAATCVAKGVKTYTCKHDSSHTKTEDIAINPKNHTGNTEIRNAKEATTEAEGYTGDTYCKDCGARISSGQKIDKLPKPTFRFDDVSNPSRYYYAPVYWAVEKGITNGYGGPNLFSPDLNCNREQIVTFLWRMMGKPKPKKHASFTDVKPTDWYYDSISWAAENNITVGLNDGTGRFGVGAPCTRAMCVTFFWRAAGKPAPKKDAGFTDTIKGRYYYDAVSWAAENKITVGLNDGTGRFGIDNYCSRAMIVTFLYRYAQLGK